VIVAPAAAPCSISSSASASKFGGKPKSRAFARGKCLHVAPMRSAAMPALAPLLEGGKTGDIADIGNQYVDGLRSA
jgi:hypothetical protein